MKILERVYVNVNGIIFNFPADHWAITLNRVQGGPPLGTIAWRLVLDAADMAAKLTSHAEISDDANWIDPEKVPNHYLKDMVCYALRDIQYYRKHGTDLTDTELRWLHRMCERADEACSFCKLDFTPALHGIGVQVELKGRPSEILAQVLSGEVDKKANQ